MDHGSKLKLQMNTEDHSMHQTRVSTMKKGGFSGTSKGQKPVRFNEQLNASSQ